MTAPTPLDTLTESHNFFVARDLPDVTPRFKTTFLFPLGYIRYLMSRVYVCILLKRLVQDYCNMNINKYMSVTQIIIVIISKIYIRNFCREKIFRIVNVY